MHIRHSAPTLDRLTVRDSVGHGVYVYDGKGLQVTSSNYINNADHGLYNATPSQVVTATLSY